MKYLLYSLLPFALSLHEKKALIRNLFLDPQLEFHLFLLTNRRSTKCNSHSEEVGGQVYDDWHLPSQDEYLDILNLYNEHLPLNDYTCYFTSNGTILDRSTNQFIEQYNIPSEIGYICIRKSSNRYRLF